MYGPIHNKLMNEYLTDWNLEARRKKDKWAEVIFSPSVDTEELYGELPHLS